jgi:S-DNA-T family DNA segregation ATPase FtsK/SpoIIIE
MGIRHTLSGARRRSDRTTIHIQPRKWQPLPSEPIVLPNPPQRPNPPNKPNLALMITSPLTTMTFAIIMLITGDRSQLRTWLYALPAFMMGFLVPAVQIISYRASLGRHRAAIARQDQEFQQVMTDYQSSMEHCVSEQRRILQEERPTLAELIRRVDDRRRMWDHLTTHNDFLALRVGAASVPLCVPVKVPPIDPFRPDERVEYAHQLAAHYGTVHEAPLVVPLREMMTVGVTSGGGVDAHRMVYTMLANLLAFHSPLNVHLYVFSHRKDAGDRWGWLKWAPHTGALTGDGSHSRISFTARSSERLLQGLTAELRQRDEVGALGLPYIVVLFDDAPEAMRSPATSMLLDAEEKMQTCAIFTGMTVPNNCRAYVTVQGGSEGFLVEYAETWAGGPEGVRVHGKAEIATLEQVSQLARSMAPLKVEDIGRELPGSVRLVELFEYHTEDPYALDIEALYDNHQGRSYLDFPIGLESNLRPLHMRLGELPRIAGHEDPNQGIHAMLAGTTGAGKSVTLESIVLSMCVCYPPDQCNILIADFKGGASQLKKLADLPHCAGYISDLSPALAERARIAIESEILHRQNMMARAGSSVQDITAYNRWADQQGHPRMPQLVIVLDEFARALEVNKPFRDTMDDVGKRGRALGVHMILSTQKAGDFDDRLRTNMQYHVSLRVESREDSRMMLRRDEAFRIPPYQRGRGYMQVGDNAVFEEFQSARADTIYQPDSAALGKVEAYKVFRVEGDGKRSLLFRSEQIDDRGADSRGPSDAEVLIERIKAICAQRGYSPARPIYLEELPTAARLPLSRLLQEEPVYRRWAQGKWSMLPGDSFETEPAEEDSRAMQTMWWAEHESSDHWLKVPVGRFDYPAQRIQGPWYADLNANNGNLWVVGSAGSGKALLMNTLVMSLAATHAPEDIHLYFLDFGRRQFQVYENLPHCGGVFLPAEAERVMRLFDYLYEEMTYRQGELAQARVESPAEFRARFPERRMPAIIVFIDNFAKFREAYEGYLERLGELAKAGRSVDLHFVISTEMPRELHYRVKDMVLNRVALRLFGEGYQEVLELRGALPPVPEIEGRGLILMGDDVAECQAATPVADLNQSMPQQLASIVQSMDALWDNRERPRRFYALPAQVELRQMFHVPPVQTANPEALITAPLGLYYSDLSPCILDLEEFGPLSLVIGPPQSGKTEFLVTLVLASALRYGPEKLEIVAIDYHARHLRELRHIPGLTYLAEGNVAGPLSGIVEKLNERAEIGRRLRAEQTEHTLAQPMSLTIPRTLLLIDDIQSMMAVDAAALKMINDLVPLVRDARISMVIAGQAGDVSRGRMSNAAIQRAQADGSGVVFSLDMNDTGLLGYQPSAAERRLYGSFPAGRGYLIQKRQAEVVQFAMAMPERTERAGGAAYGRGATEMDRVSEEEYRRAVRDLISIITGATLSG